MKPQPFRVGLVGLGGVANFHIAVLRKMRGVRLVGGCDPNPQRRDFIRRRWKLAHTYSSLHELLENQELDSVHVLTPPPSHVSVALECLQRRLHCLVEKPIALAVDEGRRLEQAASENQRTVGVNHNKLWNPAFRCLARSIRKSQLGEIRHVTVEHAVNRDFNKRSWMQDHLRFPILETAPHTFSLVSYLLGPVRNTRDRICSTTTVAGPKQLISSWQSSLECERGHALAFVSLDGSLPCCTVSVLGSKGAAHADLLENTFFQSQKLGRFERYSRVLTTARKGVELLSRSVISAATLAAERVGYSGFADPFLESMRASIGDFYEALRDNRQPQADLAAGLQAVHTCEMVAEGLSSDLERWLTPSAPVEANPRS